MSRFHLQFMLHRRSIIELSKRISKNFLLASEVSLSCLFYSIFLQVPARTATFLINSYYSPVIKFF